MHFLKAVCDSKKLVDQICNEFHVKVRNNILDVSLLYKCYNHDRNLLNQLKGHLKCPHCYKGHPHCYKNDLVYSSYTSKNIKHGYLRSHNSKDHWEICPYFRKHYTKSSTKSTKGVLKNYKKLTNKKLNKIMIGLIPNNNKNPYRHTQGHVLHTKGKGTHDGVNGTNNSNNNKKTKRVRRLEWGHEPKLTPNDDKEICAFYGKTKSIKVGYKPQLSKKYGDYSDKKYFVTKFNNSRLILEPSFIKNKKFYKDIKEYRKYIKNTKSHKDIGKVFNSEYFIIVCQIRYDPKYKYPLLEIIYNEKKGIGPAMKKC